VLIHNVAPLERPARGLDSVALCTAYPNLIVTSISMFGDFGPYANYRGYELNAAHASGWVINWIFRAARMLRWQLLRPICIG